MHSRNLLAERNLLPLPPCAPWWAFSTLRDRDHDHGHDHSVVMATFQPAEGCNQSLIESISEIFFFFWLGVLAPTRLMEEQKKRLSGAVPFNNTDV